MNSDRDFSSSYKENHKRDINIKLESSLDFNLSNIKKYADSSADLNIRPFIIGDIKTSIIVIEGMVNHYDIARTITQELSILSPASNEQLFEELQNKLFSSGNVIIVEDLEKLYFLAFSGFAIILIDSINKAVAIGAQGFSYRGVSAPESESNVSGAKEAFSEPLRVNMAILRRRMKTPFMKYEIITLGNTAKNDICLAYRTDMVNTEVLRILRERIKKISLDNIQATGYIKPFLEDDRPSLFSAIGSTERPDTLAAKISEGRIGILVDGTPFAVIVPFLFNENFQSLDDYCGRPYYATLIRMIKYLSFFISILLPGIFVSIVEFNLDILPVKFLFSIISSRGNIPLSVGLEAIVIFLIYEMLKEAGLRMPKSVGHTVSFVGALVVGDAAVRAGIVSIPMLMVVALTAISSYVTPSLYETVTFLRLIFIIIGSMWGLVGVLIGFTAVIADLTGLTVVGIPITMPFSPFSLYGMRDTVIRVGWKMLGKKQFEVANKAKGNDHNE